MNGTYEEIPACLALEDGFVVKGVALGARGPHDHRVAVGEIVFNTSMTGYQEIITDPSYAGQIVTFTAPHIGNVGCNSDDEEAAKPFCRGIVVRDYPRNYSSHRAEESLDEWLREHGVIGMSRVDTRALVLHIRAKGAQRSAIGIGKSANADLLIEEARRGRPMEGANLVDEVTCAKAYSWNEGGYEPGRGFRRLDNDVLVGRPHVVAIDCGVKRSILRSLVSSGFRVTVVPANAQRDEIVALRPDALFLSNGPGDPAMATHVIQVTKDFLGRLPIFGICLGHQILALALGARTFKLPFGHRGGNHPVKDLSTSVIEITVQNHGFAVDLESLPSGAELSHVNLNDQTVEGIRFREGRAFSVQYHPEASPGPRDSQYLFRRFYESVVMPHGQT